ncbi:DNA-binding transcriptional regulator LsrR, DeoR family [Arboricoccus pini]|uniref:DNA-binding transcriptional regulator LsrR, DeoR family n=1 Tax=Arboricoccus pini TaxID=1963835 RepID=A0A212RQG0_9PROT|nr:sugar-binding transcriptional regulator [Arboricoccus pini]SNB74813.1 DNA-binding transcriptional regulator LsrR, DeoR family [Arboricoccus pini]
MEREETDLAARAAWLSYVGEMTQEAIAARLRVSRIKVTRLIAQAQRLGLVRVFVDGEITHCLALENAITAAFGLEFCSVAPDLGEDGIPLKALASAGARYLMGALDGSRTIGLGHGRTLAAMVESLPRQLRPDIRFVSLLGSLTRKAAAHPFDVIHKISEITGGEGYFVPAPFFSDSREDRDVFIAQRSVATVFAMAAAADLYLVGVGDVGPGSQLLATGMITPSEQRAIVRAGGVGEVLGTFVDANGRKLSIELNERSVAVDLEILRGKEALLVAGGEQKAQAIAAVLRTGIFKGLIVDERTAASLTEGATIDTQMERKRKAG